MPQTYVTIPDRLVADLHDSPLAIGLYSLIARLYLIEQAPIPLSTIDVQRYDPQLSRGAVIRALSRLVRRGWLVEYKQAGHKTRYVPTWGAVRGVQCLWQMHTPKLGRPSHIRVRRLDRRLLDVYMGRLVPHATRAACINRYVTQPLLGLSDVGTYALALAGQPAQSPLLLRYGLIANCEAQPVPDDTVILAYASQRALDDVADSSITRQGWARIGWACGPIRTAATSSPIFFVPANMIGSMIGSVIGSKPDPDLEDSALERDVNQAKAPEPIVPGSQTNQATKAKIPPPNPPQPDGGGDQLNRPNSKRRQRSRLQDSAVTQALRAINVRPDVIAELASLPLSQVQAAIEDGRARSEVRDLAGWVVAMLRDVRDYGWEIATARRAVANRGSEVNRLAQSIARAKSSGLFLSDDDFPPVTTAAPTTSAIAECSAPEPDVETRSVPNAESEVCQPDLAELTESLRRDLRALVRPGYRSVIDDLRVVAAGSGPIVIGCTTAEHRRIVQEELMAALGQLLSRAGLLGAVQIVLLGRSSAAQPGAGPTPLRPDWIPLPVWQHLTPVLRAALGGATLDAEGQVSGATPARTALLQTRLAREVAALLDQIRSSSY